MSVGMNFMHRPPEYSVAFGKADHSAHGATTPLSLSLFLSLPRLSVPFFLSWRQLSWHVCISLSQASVWGWYACVNSISHFAMAHGAYQHPQQMEINHLSAGAPSTGGGEARHLPRVPSRPSIGAHLAIVTQEMEQLNWRAVGLVWGVPARKYRGFLEALSTFDVLCLVSRIRGNSVSVEFPIYRSFIHFWGIWRMKLNYFSHLFPWSLACQLMFFIYEGRILLKVAIVWFSEDIPVSWYYTVTVIIINYKQT